MARKHDQTALLPFPTRLAQPDRVEPQVPRLRHRDDPTTLTRGPVQLDQLDLTEMVRHHAAARGRGEWQPNPSSGRVGRQGPASRRKSRSLHTDTPTDGLTFRTGFATPTLGVVRTRPVAGRSVEATRESSSSDGAVPGSGFYLDLIGAVTVMALVLLAAILV